MKKFLTITCGSVTVVMLLYALLSGHDLAPDITNAAVFQTFVMSASMSFLMVLAERFQKDSALLDVLIKVFICYLVVFLEGAFFGMIEFSWMGLLEITPVLLPAFIITYLIQYLMYVEWADNINRSIKHKKSK